MARSKRFTLFALPGRPVHSNTNSAYPGSILAMLQLRAKTKSISCPPLSIARYSFIQLSQLKRQWRERKCPIFGNKGGFEPGPTWLRVRCHELSLPLNRVCTGQSSDSERARDHWQCAAVTPQVNPSFSFVSCISKHLIECIAIESS